MDCIFSRLINLKYMSEIYGKVRYDVDTKIINSSAYTPDMENFPEYQEMLLAGNYIDVTYDEFLDLTTKIQNGIIMCVIDGVLQEYQKTPEELAVELRAAKYRKRMQLIANHYAVSEIVTIEIPFQGRTEYVQFTSRTIALQGIQRQLYRIEHDVEFSTAVDPFMSPEYQGLDRMYYSYLTEFSINNAIDNIIFKQSKKAELISFFNNLQSQLSTEYSNGNTAYYINYKYRLEAEAELKALTTIEEVNAFTWSFAPFLAVCPEEYIENIIYNDYT